MFQSAYQDGDCVEVFSPGGTQPIAHWKLTGKCGRLYDKGVRGYVLAVSGGAKSKMQAPKTPKATLGLRQRHLVLQVLTASSEDKPFSVELGLTDTGGIRRRLVLSSAFRVVHCTPLHAQIPLPGLRERRGGWANMSIDLVALATMCFRTVAFCSLDLLAIGPVCKVRRIFTMRGALDRSDDEIVSPCAFRPFDENGALPSAPVEPLPLRLAFPAGVNPQPKSWVISPSTLRALTSRDSLPGPSHDRTLPLMALSSAAAPQSRSTVLPLRASPPPRVQPEVPSKSKSRSTSRGQETANLAERSVQPGQGGRSKGRTRAPVVSAGTFATHGTSVGRASLLARSRQDPQIPSVSGLSIRCPTPSPRTPTINTTDTINTSGMRSGGRRTSTPSLSGRPSPSCSRFGARGVGAEEGIAQVSSRATTVVTREEEAGAQRKLEASEIAKASAEARVFSVPTVTVVRRGALGGDAFDGGRDGLPARRRALKGASVTSPVQDVSDRGSTSGIFFSECGLNPRDSLSSEGFSETETRELARSDTGGRERLLDVVGTVTPRRRMLGTDANGVGSHDRGGRNLAAVLSPQEGFAHDGTPLERNWPRRESILRQSPRSLVGCNKSTPAAISTPHTDGAATFGSELLPLNHIPSLSSFLGTSSLPRGPETPENKSSRRHSPVCTPTGTNLPQQVGAIGRWAKGCTRGTGSHISISANRRPSTTSPRSHAFNPAVAAKERKFTLIKAAGDWNAYVDTFKGDLAGREFATNPARSEKFGPAEASDGVAKVSPLTGLVPLHGGQARSNPSSPLPTTSYGAIVLRSSARVGELQAPFAPSAPEQHQNPLLGTDESISSLDKTDAEHGVVEVGEAFGSSAPKRERTEKSGFGSSAGSGGDGVDVLNWLSWKNAGPQGGNGHCDANTSTSTEDEIKNIDGGEGDPIAASGGGGNATPQDDDGNDGYTGVVRSATEWSGLERSCNKKHGEVVGGDLRAGRLRNNYNNVRSKTDAVNSPEPQPGDPLPRRVDLGLPSEERRGRRSQVGSQGLAINSSPKERKSSTSRGADSVPRAADGKSVLLSSVSAEGCWENITSTNGRPTEEDQRETDELKRKKLALADLEHSYCSDLSSFDLSLSPSEEGGCSAQDMSLSPAMAKLKTFNSACTRLPQEN